MNRKIAQIALLVKDYDEAIDFYVNKLQFKLIEDTVLDKNKRWVLVSPNIENSSSVLLAKADDENQNKFIGNQSGGRVFLFLHTNNFEKEYKNLKDNNVKIVRDPVVEPYGTVLVFEDLYGNLWDLIEPKVNLNE
ncbi:MAG: VOC family protein [Lutibacter sp.]|uniref:VOC family protein n=1 Tax=Lutibacter sp. TaxID=1925666 RepID=UPI00385DE44C